MSGTPARTTVVYIGGTSRSGSTLLECLLARTDGVVVLGEVAHLWVRGLQEDQLCACGQPFSQCPFWTQVGDHAFGGWKEVDLERVLHLQNTVDRLRRMPLTARRHASRGVSADAAAYSDYYRRIYEAARKVADARVVVDSSKTPPLAFSLSYQPQLDLRVIHIVRDSRGVAYSWSKTVPRPEVGPDATMPRLGVAKSTAYWLVHNLGIEALPHRGVPVTRIRYEDLVLEPAATVGAAWRALSLPGAGELPMLDEHTIELMPTHSVAGNPMRFSLGITELRPDVTWRSKLPARDRRVVTAMSYPLLRRMGYHAGTSTH
jgi:hypothetical protein